VATAIEVGQAMSKLQASLALTGKPELGTPATTDHKQCETSPAPQETPPAKLDDAYKWVRPRSQDISASDNRGVECPHSTNKWLNVVNICLRRDIDFDSEAEAAENFMQRIDDQALKKSRFSKQSLPPPSQPANFPAAKSP
jgi:hypothetical protein